MQVIDSQEPEVLAELDPLECVDTEQVPEAYKEKAYDEANAPGSLLVYGLFGVLFGLILVKSEVVSWFRIQEMFRFHSFHLHGVIGSAGVVAATSVALIKNLGIKTIHGEPIQIAPKVWTGIGTRYWLGGIFFGIGWALVGACPGPLFALVGGGVSVLIVAIAGALAGTWTYAFFRHRLPH